MPDGPPKLVSPEELEKLLEQAKNCAAGASQTLFPPDSIGWKVNRESALFLAAGRAALLQLAHPWVGTAIAQHSRTLNDPIGRFHHTFRVMFSVSFGTVQQAFAAARHLHRLHQRIGGTMPESSGRFAAGTRYEANELSALLWVYATLIDSSVLAYELVLPPLTATEREQYHSESAQTAALFGIPRQSLPQDWSAFRSYMESTIPSDMLAVSAATRDIAHQLQNGAGMPVRTPSWYQALTVELLPQRLREEFGFPYGEQQRRAAARAVCWLRRIYPHLPATLRFVGPYNEMQARLKGRTPGAAIRLSNRIWTGQATLFGLAD
jgi:uncharacterized protein (DUF2236 family)